ncbi:unconventional myosin-XIX [Anolis sagrei]|uniref:unconventional myosin-XIX n=1 Tax=Anolis sagrei TaxID=38937 RepID=UPI003522E933
MHSPIRSVKRPKRRREMLKQVNGTKSNRALDPSRDEHCLGGEVESFLSDERQLHLIDDLTKVNPVTTTTVLRCLQARYATHVFYTKAGCSLVAVNPFRPIPPLYTQELMEDYHAASCLQDLKPHVFLVAEETYRNVESQIPPVNQSVIVSGESGAGKTWTSRCLMTFYATVAASSSVPKGSVTAETIEKRVLDSNPVMEAFGNACTLRNSNSSRFGKYIQLQLNRSQLLTGASIQTFLLEKTRVAYQAPQERNFHIFYQVAKGATEVERLEWSLPHGAMFSWLPNSEKALEEDDFDVTREAMSHLGIDSSTQNNVFKILAGLLHLGNVDFCESEDDSQPCTLEARAKDFAKTASRLLEVPQERLVEALIFRRITAGKQRQEFKKACPKAESGMRRDCLAKTIYAKLFDWLVAVINANIYVDPSGWSNFIGLLDVYGFESFPENHLEQLCINYANEKLQQHFVSHFLKAQQEEYALEGFEWSFINYQDNQSCLDAIEGSPVSIFSLLNEECRLNRPSNAGQLQTRIEVALSENRCVGRDRFRKEPNFIVSHYAGNVCYRVEGMVEKNKDPVPPELVLLLQQSQDPLLQQLFLPPASRSSEDNVKTQTKPTVVTVVSKFKASLEQLMEILHSTTPHYIRCIKPNAECEADLFRQEEVLCQLEACGIVETVSISAAGFPVRMSFGSFLERYEVLKKSQKPNLRAVKHQENGFPPVIGNGCTAASSEEEEGAALCLAVRSILWQTCASALQPHANPAFCGKTKVFMTNAMLELLESRRMGVFSAAAFCIQRFWWRFKRRRQAKRLRSALVIQSGVRSWMARKRFQEWRKAAAVVQRAWKQWKAKRDAKAAEELDGVDGGEAFLGASLPAKCSHQGTSVIQFWPLGFLPSMVPSGPGCFWQNLTLLNCLRILQKNDLPVAGLRSRPSHGVTSVRAIPQGSIKFRCRKSPLLFADTRPNADIVTGFNQILLDKRLSA